MCLYKYIYIYTHDHLHDPEFSTARRRSSLMRSYLGGFSEYTVGRLSLFLGGPLEYCWAGVHPVLFNCE